MRLALGSDHAGFELKKQLAAYLVELEHGVVDMGTHSTEPVDYPDVAESVAMALIDSRTDRGILICGSGVCFSVAANKIPEFGRAFATILTRLTRVWNTMT